MKNSKLVSAFFLVNLASTFSHTTFAGGAVGTRLDANRTLHSGALSENRNSFSELYGAVSGGGGKGLVCSEVSATGASPVELLDLWEGRTLFGEIAQTQNLPLAEAVDAALIRMKNAFPFIGGGMSPDNRETYENQEYILYFLRLEAKRFLEPDSKTLRLRGVILTSTDDSFEAARPQNCEVRNVVNYQPGGRILVDQDLFERMDLTSQTALIVHEAFYSLLRELNQEKSSIRVRRAVAYVLSGKDFNLTTPPFVKKYLQCSSSLNSSPKTIWNIRTDTNRSSQVTRISFYPQLIAGSVPIGLSKGIYSVEISSQANLDIMQNKTCAREGQMAGIRFDLDGPVESDRVTTFSVSCVQHRIQLFVSDVGADHESTPISLNCELIDTTKPTK